MLNLESGIFVEETVLLKSFDVPVVVNVEEFHFDLSFVRKCSKKVSACADTALAEKVGFEPTDGV